MKALRVVLAITFLFFSNAVAAQVKKGTIKKKPVVSVQTQVKRLASNPTAGLVRIKLTTDSGIIIIRLYDSTPLHRDNFVKLVNNRFFDSLLFHRIIKGFMIQGGDPMSKFAQPGEMLGMGGGDMERIPAEMKPSLIHKKGTLCAARDGNPQMASSACQFYIVQGQKFNDNMLNMYEAQTGRKYTPAQRLAYKTLGGTPQLDMNYTVFGEVEKGLAVIDKIAGVATQPGDRPIGDIRMKIEILPATDKQPAKKL
jgi:cyclophilin family peptidyl-prolyl cis-trans isomerase